MPLYRVRAMVAWPEAHGELPRWAQAQMDVRHGQAVTIRPGRQNREEPTNRRDGLLWWCDLPLANLAHAQDAVNTLADPNVLGQSVEVDEDGTPSFVELHECRHADDPPGSCTILDVRYGPGVVVPGDEWQAWVFYDVGAEVLDGGALYRCIQAHTSQPGWEPSVTPALWELVDEGGDGGGDTDEWQAGVDYVVSPEPSVVSYDGVTYRCLQAHTSQVGWEPPNVPALWEPI